MVSSVFMLIFIVPSIDQNLSPFLRYSRMKLVHRIFTIRNEILPFLTPKLKGSDPESNALIELIRLYQPYLQLSNNATENEINMLRYHSKRISVGLHPTPSPSCLIETHTFQHNTRLLKVSYIQHDEIDDWKTSDKPLILYFHGGGFVFGGIDSYSGYECHLSKYLNMLVLHVHLRLAPEYLIQDTIDDVIAIYNVLIQNSVNVHERLIGMGDSSGGMLWIHLLQWIVLNNKPLPRGVVLHSPWTGLDFLNLRVEFCTDYYLPASLIYPLRKLATGMTLGLFELSIDEQKKLNPKVNSFQGFPPLYITAGTDEIFSDEIRLMTEKMKKERVDVILDEGEGLKHSYALFHLWSLKARCVQKIIRIWIYEQLKMERTLPSIEEMDSDDPCELVT